MTAHTALYATGAWCGWPWIASADTKALPLSFDEEGGCPQPLSRIWAQLSVREDYS